MAKVNIILDGKSVEVIEGQTILDAARANGIDIPTLCHDPRLKPTAACRLCLVDVEKMRTPVPACNTQVTPGMVINTASPAVMESRRIALELLLSDHYGDCISPCQTACPAGIDIQCQIAFIANRQYSDALKLIKESNPLPLVCGRVCPRFCEKQCRRTLVDQPVAINLLKRFVADMELQNKTIYTPPRPVASGKSVAIIGGGPAGLSAAYYLALQGHSVSIFESNPQLGGMLRYGIPEYRLPKAVLDREIGAIAAHCQSVQCGVSLGRDFSLADLKSRGFDSVFLALGAQIDQKMRIPGENLAGVYSGIGFLRDVIEDRQTEMGQKVIVVGGGNTAIDAARTALRKGAWKVTLVYRRSRAEMPASAEEVEGAEQEGIHFNFLTNPIKIVERNGRVAGIECLKMQLGAPDSSGRRKPEAVPGSEFVIEADSVIMALGQSIDSCGLDKTSGLIFNSRGGVKVNPETMLTNLPGVFSGGDCTEGPATAVEAIGAGKRAARYIDQYLRSGQVIPEVKKYNCTKGDLHTVDKAEFSTVEKSVRAAIPALSAEDRKNNFKEIDSVIDEQTALKEAARCLSCGCQDAFNCHLRELATQYKVDDRTYAGQKKHLPILKNEHPFIVRDRNKCILCGRCVRICSEVEGANALGYAHRGFITTIEPAMEKPLSMTSCDSCGQCISTCPTGALTARLPLPKPGPLKLNKVSSTCTQCGIGCALDIKVNAQQIVEVESPLENPVNRGNLCSRGKFNLAYPVPSNRLLQAQIIRNGITSTASRDEAIDLAARSLQQIKTRFGPQSIAVACSPTWLNEDLYLAQKMARSALHTNNVICLADFAHNNSLARTLGSNSSTCSYADIAQSDFILLFDCDPVVDYPVVAMQIRKAVDSGSRMAVLNASPSALDPLSSITIKVNHRTSVDLLKAVLKYLVNYNMIDRGFVQEKTTGYESLLQNLESVSEDLITRIPWVNPSRLIEVIHTLVRARRPVIIIDGDTISADELRLLADIALATGNARRPGSGILKLHSAYNAQGLLDMGISPVYLPGYRSVNADNLRLFSQKWGTDLSDLTFKDPDRLLAEIERGDIKGLLVFGKEALGEFTHDVFTLPLFSMLVDTEMPGFTPLPQILLPAASPLESQGTCTNCERRVQPVNPITKAPAGYYNWQNIAALSSALGYPMHYNNSNEILAEISTLVPGYPGEVARFLAVPPFAGDSSFNPEPGKAVFRFSSSSSPANTAGAAQSGPGLLTRLDE